MDDNKAKAYALDCMAGMNDRINELQRSNETLLGFAATVCEIVELPQTAPLSDITDKVREICAKKK